MPVFNNSSRLYVGNSQISSARKGLGQVFSRWNVASGGTTSDVSNYNGTGQTWRIHRFTGNGALIISASKNPFKLLLVGGGGGAALNQAADDEAGGGGGGGVLEVSSANIPTGSFNVVVGNGGGLNSAGQASSIASWSISGGNPGNIYTGGSSGNGFSGGAGANANGGGGAGAGQAGWRGYDWFGGDGGNGVQSNVSGTMTCYGGGGGSSGIKGAGRTDGWSVAKQYCRRPERRGPTSSNLAAGGEGGGGGLGSATMNGVNGLGGGGGGYGTFGTSGIGGSGLVIVAYQIG